RRGGGRGGAGGKARQEGPSATGDAGALLWPAAGRAARPRARASWRGTRQARGNAWEGFARAGSKVDGKGSEGCLIIRLYMCWACCGSVCRLAVVGCCHGDRWHSEQARLREHHGRCRGRRGGSSGGACPKQARGRVGQAEHRACRVRVRLLRAAVDAMAAEEEQARQEERRSRG
ncbi:unnamed protein product, partial [Prorocentrum cordatum]